MKRFAFIALLAVAGCDTAPFAASSQPSSTPGASANAGPGPRYVVPNQAAGLFQSICLNSGPNFATAVDRLDGTFVQNTKTGTYYNRTLDLSFKINGNGRTQCSMVFKSSAQESEVRNAFRDIGHPNALRSAVTSSRGYYRAVISSL